MPVVESEAILRVHYEAANSTMSVVFRTGRHYEFFDVPQDEYERFLASPSKGEYFNRHIRDRYRYRKVK